VGQTEAFKDLAWGLATRGIAVLRYEKRSRAHPETLRGDVTLASDTIDDALHAVDVARADPRIAKVFYLGHSQGAMAAPRAGTRDAKLAGLIVMAGPARPLEDILLAQLEYLQTDR